ncbi:uncharacterized protein [Arachis hypogaea]|uniref:uncharacterized protein n=1 Tax=Arachis hypogaea TaxID=3818 RepID=UPI003B2108B9
MFDVHGRLMLQHVMELYVEVRDMVGGFGPSTSMPHAVLVPARLIYFADPWDSVDQGLSDSDSDYIVDSGSSDDSESSGEHLSEVPSYYHTLNLDAMQLEDPFNLGDSEDYNTNGGGVLLIVVAQDGNNSILPIAFALVESESIESWYFFLMNLREHVTLQHGVILIYDRSQAIRAALNAANSEGKRYLVNATYSPSKKGCDWYLDMLKGLSRDMLDWTLRFKKALWLQHCDKGHRFSHMTTNLSECIKGHEVQAQLNSGQVFSQQLLAAIEKNRNSLPKITVTHCDRRALVFSVDETKLLEEWSQISCPIRLNMQQCDCGVFQDLHYPCRHALAACSAASIEWGAFVNLVYRIDLVFKVYEIEFPSIPNEKM